MVAHATRDGRTEAVCRELVAWRKPLYTFDTHENANLLALGVSAWPSNDLPWPT